MNDIATLHNANNNYSEFCVGDLRIKFYTSPNLIDYKEIVHWDNKGYIEYKGRFSTSDIEIEDTIDLAFIAERLHLSPEVFGGIREVRIV